MNNGDIRKKITFIVTAEIQRTIQKAKITDISQGRTALTDAQKFFLRKHNRIGQMTQKTHKENKPYLAAENEFLQYL